MSLQVSLLTGLGMLCKSAIQQAAALAESAKESEDFKAATFAKKLLSKSTVSQRGEDWWAVMMANCLKFSHAQSRDLM